MNLAGHATVWVKVPGEPLRPLTDENAVPLFLAAGAATATAKSARAIVEAFGPTAGLNAADTVALIVRAG